MTKNTTLHKLFDVPDNTILNPEDISKLLNMHVESVRRWCRRESSQVIHLEINTLSLALILNSL